MKEASLKLNLDSNNFTKIHKNEDLSNLRELLKKIMMNI
jgi:hypothetical protein